MFLCTVVRPHFNPCAKCWWNGKLGIWATGEWEPVKQKSNVEEQDGDSRSLLRPVNL